MKHIFIIVLFLTSGANRCFSQKVKYKDLFVLLNAENYNDADSYLRLFLAAEPDEPHANYSMGKMLQNYMYQENLIKSRVRILELADSSIIYFDKAAQLSTEKYVEKKHNDDYYAEFRKRDLRTGKFTVKLNTVQLDIENRKIEIVKFKDDAAKLNQYLEASISYYDSSYSIYENFTEVAENKNLLYFTTGADELQNLRNLASTYDSSVYNLDTYMTIMKEMGTNAISQTKTINPIEDYPTDGISKTDFYGPSIDIWNYKEWAKSTLDVVGKQIYPLKGRMIAYDKKLQELTEEVINDSIDARSAIFKLATENVGRDIRVYDAHSLPAAIYNYRIAEINYRSTINFWYKELIDTINVGLKIDGLTGLEKQLGGISKLAIQLREANNDIQTKIFNDFITERYEDENGIDIFVKEQLAFVHDDSIQLHDWLSKVKEQDKITIWQDDSISLLVGHEFINNDSIRFSTVLIDSLTERKLGFYAWIEDNKSLALSFSISPSSRVLDTLYTIPINPKLVEQRILNLQFLSDSLGVEKRVWVLSTTEPGKDASYILQVFITDLATGAGWDKEFSAKEIPRAVKFNHENHRISLLGDSDSPIMILDEYGDKQEISPD